MMAGMQWEERTKLGQIEQNNLEYESKIAKYDSKVLPSE